jgi:hypothetical protein
VIDGFASQGLQAVLIDKEFFMVYDNLQKLETVRNSKGLYWNYFYHVWQTMSASRFANAVAFVSGAVPAVTNVVVDPVIASLKQGSTFQFTAYVRATDGNTYTPTWTVLPSTSSTTKLAGTTIDANGNLTIDANQTGELVVRATVSGAGNAIDGTAWQATTAYTVGQTVNAGGNVYQVTVAGTSGSTAPSFTSGTATNGTVTFKYVGVVNPTINNPDNTDVIGESIVTISI